MDINNRCGHVMRDFESKAIVTFNFNKHDVIDLTKFSKMTMCRVVNPLFFGQKIIKGWSFYQ